MLSTSQHIVIPGQVIATSSNQDEEQSFLRGHGTYLENVLNTNTDHDNNNNNHDTNIDSSYNYNDKHNDSDNDENQHEHQIQVQNHHLIASTTGTITRTNKLIQITPPNAPYYTPQTGDPIIGRITSISNTRWNVSLHLTSHFCSIHASLPLTGIQLENGMQRIRTNADALTMRNILVEGDLISAEVRSVQNYSSTSSSATSSGSSGTNNNNVASTSGASAIGNVILHARSVRCGKLENGCFVMVPNWLIPRLKKQFVVLGLNKENSNTGNTSTTTKYKRGFNGIPMEVLLGCNGGIWIQRAMMELESSGSNGSGNSNGNGGDSVIMQEKVQEIRSKHAQQVMTLEERIVLARVKNAIEALKLVHCVVTPKNIEAVVEAAVDLLGGEKSDGDNDEDGGRRVHEMTRHDVVLQITACTRQRRNY